MFKNVLKKEKCYNTVMTTANLQAVQGKYFIVKVKCSVDHYMQKVILQYYCVDDDNAVDIAELPCVCQHYIP